MHFELGQKIIDKIRGKKVTIVEHIIKNKKYTLEPNTGLLVGSFFKYLSKQNFKDDYLKLMSGLDDESALTVQRILSRILQFEKTTNNNFFLSEEEVDWIKETEVNFHKLIIKLEDDVWAYKKYLLPVNSFESQVIYEKHYLDKFTNLDTSKSIIDVGGFVGDSALIFSDYTTDKVHTFEPMQELYKLLQKTIELNKLTNVVAVNKGLSDRECEMDIFDNGSSSSIKNIPSESDKVEKCSFTTLDKYVQENNLQVGLIKVDVEGAEQLFLAGAKKTICEQKPALMLSIYHNAEDFFQIKPMIENWNLGYTFRIMRQSPKNLLSETVLLAEIIK